MPLSTVLAEASVFALRVVDDLSIHVLECAKDTQTRAGRIATNARAYIDDDDADVVVLRL